MGSLWSVVCGADNCQDYCQINDKAFWELLAGFLLGNREGLAFDSYVIALSVFVPADVVSNLIVGYFSKASL